MPPKTNVTSNFKTLLGWSDAFLEEALRETAREQIFHKMWSIEAKSIASEKQKALRKKKNESKRLVRR